MTAARSTITIGVVADTHVGECLPWLPDSVERLLSGVDAILHAGDITDLAVLERLGRVAPVLAVQGDHDRQGGLPLPRYALIRAGRHRIGLTHGRRARPVEMAAAAASLATGKLCLLGLHRSLRRRLPEVDCVAYGHLHLPVCRVARGVLHFNPGAVYVPEGDPGYLDGPVAAAHLRFRARQAAEDRQASIGLLEAGPRGLVASVLPLDGGPVRIVGRL